MRRIKILGNRPAPPALRGRGTAPARPRQAPERIQRREISYWQERGWLRQGQVYHGAFQTPYGSFRGMVEDRGAGDLRFYMFDPPQSVRNSSHWACFAPRRQKGFQVHMGTRPADVSSGIMTIERLITHSFEDS